MAASDYSDELILDILKSRAGHFANNEWQYTRSTKIKHIRYEDDWSGYYSPWGRTKRAFEHLYERHGNLAKMLGMDNWSGRWNMFKYSFKSPDNNPDGHLDGGGVITVWEENGEYLQLVSPHIGELIADLLKAHPYLPEARVVIDAMKVAQDKLHEEAKRGGWAAPEKDD